MYVRRVVCGDGRDGELLRARSAGADQSLVGCRVLFEEREVLVCHVLFRLLGFPHLRLRLSCTRTRRRRKPLGVR